MHGCMYLDGRADGGRGLIAEYEINAREAIYVTLYERKRAVDRCRRSMRARGCNHRSVTRRRRLERALYDTNVYMYVCVAIIDYHHGNWRVAGHGSRYA